MVLDRWDPRRLEAAVRAGEAVDLRATTLGKARPEQVVPLCHAVTNPDWQRWLAPGAVPNGRTEARVTVVIPTATGIPAGLRALAAQDEPVDVVVLWNGSGPAPEMPGVTVRTVPWRGHGATRQAAVADVRTPYLLFLVDDAIPLGAGFVRTLVDGLESTSAEAVWARQVPWPTASTRIRDRLAAWCPTDGGSPPSRLDHVCALHRAALLRTDPLDDTPIAEDWLWGRRHRCALVPGAPVLHSHPPGFRRTLARTRAIHKVLRANGERPTVRGVRDVVLGMPGVIGDRDGLAELIGQWGG